MRVVQLNVVNILKSSNEYLKKKNLEKLLEHDRLSCFVLPFSVKIDNSSEFCF